MSPRPSIAHAVADAFRSDPRRRKLLADAKRELAADKAKRKKAKRPR